MHTTPKSNFLASTLAVMLLSLLPITTHAAPHQNEPAAYGPVPSPRQLEWHKMEYYGLVCYGIETYTGQEWGYGDDPFSLFAPTDLNTDQWCKAAKEGGMTGLIGDGALGISSGFSSIPP